MSQTSLTASFAQIIALNPFPGNQPARIVGTKWRIKNRSKTSNRGRPPEILDESMNYTGWYSKLLIRQKFRSGAIPEVFDLFLVRHFVLKNSSAMICSSDAVREVWDMTIRNFDFFL